MESASCTEESDRRSAAVAAKLARRGPRARRRGAVSHKMSRRAARGAAPDRGAASRPLAGAAC